MIPSPYLVTPGEQWRLADCPTSSKGDFKSKKQARAALRKNLRRLGELQEILYAQRRHAVLVVFQATDAGGKDGAIRHVFSGVNPQGCLVTSFKAPSDEELAHDYLWRIHRRVPRKGIIGIFNRSHYEDVLIVRVKQLVPQEVWSRRYEHINNFERMLAEEGTLILKFFLHISRDEQKKRLQARLDDPKKHWKFNPADLAERERWDDYQQAYHEAIQRCSTPWAPWYVVPADRKWYRNWVISDTIVRTLENLEMNYPPASDGLDDIEIE